jgi:hypothetical protein
MLIRSRRFRGPSKIVLFLLVSAATIIGTPSVFLLWGAVPAVSLGAITFRQPSGDGREFYGDRVEHRLALSFVQVSWNPPRSGMIRSGEDLALSVAPSQVPTHIRSLIEFRDPFRSYAGLDFGFPFRFVTIIDRMTGPGDTSFSQDGLWHVTWWAAILDWTLHVGLTLVLLLAIRATFLTCRSNRRIRKAHCWSCDHDLNALDHTTCPECGTPTR